MVSITQITLSMIPCIFQISEENCRDLVAMDCIQYEEWIYSRKRMSRISHTCCNVSLTWLIAVKRPWSELIRTSHEWCISAEIACFLQDPIFGHVFWHDIYLVLGRDVTTKMNIAKTKVMVVDNTPINVNNVLIENVPGYVYNSCVLPAMTYGAETWTLTKLAQNKLAAAQTKMERSMLNSTYKDRSTNIWVRERTKLIDKIYTVRKMKWSWAGHINRLKDDRWTSRVTAWRPYDKKRRQGRPAKRWRDDLDKYRSDTIWQRTAQYRVIWRRHAEAFAQPRDTTAA